MKDQELILRFFALYDRFSKYQRPLSEFINKYANANRNPKPSKQGELATLFCNAIDAFSASLPGRPFRLTTSLNAAVYDSCMVGMARRLSAEAKKKLNHRAVATAFLENALKEVYSDYVRSCSSPAVADFVEARLVAIQNPKAGRFLETAGAFRRVWASDLEVFLDDDGRREAIDSIMANRHLIAHGKDSGITLSRVKDYLAKSVRVIEFIEAQCEG